MFHGHHLHGLHVSHHLLISTELTAAVFILHAHFYRIGIMSVGVATFKRCQFEFMLVIILPAQLRGGAMNYYRLLHGLLLPIMDE